jgi:hypothetical protein
MCCRLLLTCTPIALLTNAQRIHQPARASLTICTTSLIHGSPHRVCGHVLHTCTPIAVLTNALRIHRSFNTTVFTHSILSVVEYATCHLAKFLLSRAHRHSVCECAVLLSLARPFLSVRIICLSNVMCCTHSRHCALLLLAHHLSVAH